MNQTDNNLQWPGLAKGLLIAAIVFSSIGILTGGAGLLNSRKTEQQLLEETKELQKNLGNLDNANEEYRQLSDEASVQTIKGNAHLRPWFITYSAAHFLFSIAMLILTIMTLLRMPAGRNPLRKVCLAKIPVEFLYVYVSWKTAMVSMAALKPLMNAMASGQANLPMDPGTIINASFYAGIATSVGIAGLLTTLYIMLFIQLDKKPVRALFKIIEPS